MPNAAGLYYFVHEGENLTRPPVILIHGAGGTHLSWPAQVRRLPGERIYALDLPGHGRSEGLGRQTVSEYAQAILEFMQEATLRAAVIIGHSLGGAIALSLTLDHPEQVLGLGLLGSAPKLQVAPAILAGLSNPAGFRQMVHLITQNSYAAGSEVRLRELGEQRLAETRSTVLHGDFIASSSFDATPDLQRIRVPTLILCGAEDKLAPPERSRALKAGIAGSKLRRIPAAGHMLMLEQPDEVAKALGKFLSVFQFRPGQ